jgi:hypothetical protein
LILLFGVLAALAVVLAALPASVITRFLPAVVHAEDFSGSLWHGSAGRITVNAREAGALEWRLHPGALLGGRVAADFHWVKAGFVLDGVANAGRNRLEASNIQGGGPLEDLQEFGAASGWRGIVKVQVKELKAALSSPTPDLESAVGDIEISGLSAAKVAAGADLGGYALHFVDPLITPDADATALLTDTGGPLAIEAVIHLSLRDRRGLLSGAVKARPDAPAELRTQVDDLAQLHARDAQGRIPVDLEFTF